MAYIKHATAIVESAAIIGDGTCIGAFAHVLRRAKIGCDCLIGDHTFIEDDVIVGNRVIVKSGVQLCAGLRIEDDVFIGPNAAFPNERYATGTQLHGTVVKRGASIGAHATVLPGITIEENAMIGAGAVVTQHVPRSTVVVGNPSRIVGYAGAEQAVPATSPGVAAEGTGATHVKGVVLHRLPLVHDLRGCLSFGEVARDVPFEVKRYFLVFQVSSEQLRGEHAHRAQHQFLIAVHGRCAVVADDGFHRQEFILDAPNLGLYLPPMTWSVQYKYSPEAVLLVLASGEYDAAEYIRNYAEFLDAAAHSQSQG
jgi:acetyltransferase-like isoleucine patch superfamily enzyme/dTDP-4-dehydrorhamnose 3,5-epimerase-like enzyme